MAVVQNGQTRREICDILQLSYTYEQGAGWAVVPRVRQNNF